MFVGLGMNREIVGFGLILNASRHELTIQSSANDFNKIHLSNSGICKKNGTRIDTSNRLIKKEKLQM